MEYSNNKISVSHQKYQIGDTKSSLPNKNNELMRFRFTEYPNIEQSDCLATYTPSIEPQVIDEVWAVSEQVHTKFMDDCLVSQSTDYLLVSYTTPFPTSVQLSKICKESYHTIFNAASKCGHFSPLRMWNYIPNINEGLGDDENYRQFSIGRAEYIESTSLDLKDLPAGTAVGTGEGTPLSFILLCSRADFTTIENRRQLSAYYYPSQYGPRSPFFSRAMRLNYASGSQMLLSGTASIKGHKTMNRDNVEAQIDEIEKNVRSLIEDNFSDLNCDYQQSCLRVYVRNAEHLKKTKQKIETLFPGIGQIIYLQADICRADLLVEVEGLFTFANQ